jgi:hypothetical protein
MIEGPAQKLFVVDESYIEFAIGDFPQIGSRICG